MLVSYNAFVNERKSCTVEIKVANFVIYNQDNYKREKHEDDFF